MGGIVKNWVEFDENTPESERTIDFRLTEDQTKRANEYNISVTDAAGAAATGTVVGSVSAEFYFPGSDRAQTTMETADLSTGCRQFPLFYATVDRASFSVSNLTPGHRVRVEAIRGVR